MVENAVSVAEKYAEKIRHTAIMIMYNKLSKIFFSLLIFRLKSAFLRGLQKGMVSGLEALKTQKSIPIPYSGVQVRRLIAYINFY